MYLNQSKNMNIFLAQLIPDNTINYQVKYSFDSGTIGNGNLNGGSVVLGKYQPISLGSSSLSFKATALGIVNLLIEVKNSNGLLKSTVVMFEIKSTDFEFTGGSQNNNLFTNETTPLNFDLSELVSSGTQYEMSYSINSGSITIKDGVSTVNANQWYPLSTGAFTRDMTVLSPGNVSVIFTVRNKTTLQSKSILVNVSSYQKPTPINVYTSLDFFNRQNHDDEWRFYIYMDFLKDPSATISSIVFTVNGDIYNLNPAAVSLTAGAAKGQEFLFEAGNSSRRGKYDSKAYSIKVTDSNGIINTYNGTWRNNEF